MSITEQIDELLLMEQTATAGPWINYKYGITHAGGTVVSWDHGTQDHDGVNEPADKPFIVALRNRTPALLRVLRALIKERMELFPNGANSGSLTYASRLAINTAPVNDAIREAEKEQVHAAE